jgi:hypothetical protein
VQQGRYLAQSLNDVARIAQAGSPEQADALPKPGPFVYKCVARIRPLWDDGIADSVCWIRHLGSLAYIGNAAAVADFGSGKFTLGGFMVWWLWRSYYWSYVSGGNRGGSVFWWSELGVCTASKRACATGCCCRRTGHGHCCLVATSVCSDVVCLVFLGSHGCFESCFRLVLIERNPQQL